jgi:hypothetical protein
MKYYIQRGASEYGPYTLADLQRYVAQGNILLGDLTRSEGMTEWVPVAQVIGNIPIPVPAGQPAAGAAYGAGAAVGGGPMPPDFHWAFVLLINFLCYWFGWIWLFVEANFVKKIVPQSKAILWLALAVAGVFCGGIAIAFADSNHWVNSSMGGRLGLLILFCGGVFYLIAVFSMRSDIESYYNTTENINLRLTGVGSALLTLFFAVYYFQWHFSRIAKWKKTGVLEPQN